MAKSKGIIKWFNNEVGCGFIETKDGESIFISDINLDDDMVRLYEGEKVKFDLIGGATGLIAVNVHKL